MAAELSAASAVVGTVFLAKKELLDPLMVTIASSNDMEEIHGTLKEAMAMLHSKRIDHHNEIQRNKAKMPSETYNDWIRKVMEIEDEEEVKKLDNRFQKERRRASWVCFSQRSNFSEEMKKKAKKVVNLLLEGNQLGDFLVDKKPERVVQMIAPDIKEFPTLQKPLEEILVLLSNNKVKGIRVRGTVGVGKTTIIQNLNNHEKVSEMFETVIWLKVSTELNKGNFGTEHLQQAIVRRLKLDMDGNSHVDEVAHRIREELKGVKYLLLLDDVKDDLDLQQIGIPESKNGSKIVLTTRLSHVCHLMVDRVINVEKLNPKEARKMFQNVLGQPKLRDDPKIEPLMRKVVMCCDGLPLVIKMVASAFKMRDTEERWSDGLTNLRKSPERGDDAMKEMYKLLIFCWDYLKEGQEDCFFYSALYPEDSDIYIDRLLDCWAAQDFLGNCDDVKQMRVSGRDTLERLIVGSLLEEGFNREYVKMHKWIRKAALFKMSVDDEHKHLVKTSGALQKPVDEEYWRDKKWISLVSNEVLQSLPERPACSVLSTLFLQKNRNLKQMPDSFFEHMVQLRVLDLYLTGIMSLPSSLSKLINLKVLYLNGCTDLVQLPPEIGKLQRLEVLDVRGSGVNHIPSQIQSLTRLRRLLVSIPDLDNGYESHDMTPNCTLISKLSTLEELVIDVKSYKQWCNKMLNEVIGKVASLKKLTTLQFCFLDGILDVIKVVDTTRKICIPKVEILGSFVEKSDNLHWPSFQVFIDCPITICQIPKSYLCKRYVKYCNGKGCNNPIICEVLSKADAFEVVNHNDLDCLSNFGTTSLNLVQHCLIQSCDKINTIVDGKSINNSILLPNLERLYIKHLTGLESIWKGPMQLGSLSKLRTLEIESCHQIEEIFVEFEHAGQDLCVLPYLKKLVLVDMPKLRKICTNKSLEWPSLGKLTICGCPNLNEFPFNKNNAPKLRSIEAEVLWWEGLQWRDSAVKEQLSALLLHSV